jgi:hypothetical protein
MVLPGYSAKFYASIFDPSAQAITATLGIVRVALGPAHRPL